MLAVAHWQEELPIQSSLDAIHYLTSVDVSRLRVYAAGRMLLEITCFYTAIIPMCFYVVSLLLVVVNEV